MEWPSRPSGTLTLCIFGEDPFREALQGTDNVGGGRYLAYRRIDNLQETGDCQVLFVARGKNKIIPEIVAAVEGQEVLTIGDGEGLAEAGLMISFVHVDRKVRFEANLERARRARLMISSQLLSLALTVYNPR